MHTIFRLGNWETALVALSTNVQPVLQAFEESYVPSPFAGDNDECRRYFLIGDVSTPLSPNPPPTLPDAVGHYWADFYAAYSLAYRVFSDSTIDPVSLRQRPTPVRPHHFSFAWTPDTPFERDPHRSVHFYTLILGSLEQTSIRKILIYSLYWATLWHSKHQGLCLHSSAVAQGDQGFLFLGESTAGKSTVARLGASTGRLPLGDDFNFLLYDQPSSWRIAAAPSPKLSEVGYTSARPVLTGIFKLVQSSHDQLVALGQTQTARVLLDSLLQTTIGPKLPVDSMGLAFNTIADIARRVPAYNLHFRKSPDFWNVIDAEFAHT